MLSVFSVDYNDELDVLVSGSADFSVKVWSFSAGACLNTLTGHTEWVTKVSSTHIVSLQKEVFFMVYSHIFVHCIVSNLMSSVTILGMKLF